MFGKLEDHVDVSDDDDDNEDNWPPVNEVGAPWIRQTRDIIARVVQKK